MITVITERILRRPPRSFEGTAMKQHKLQFIVLIALLTSPVLAQEADVDRLDEKLRHQLETKMPGWSYKRLKPTEGSKGVLLQTWKIENRAVSISVVQTKSGQAAQETIQRLAQDPSTHARPLADTGEEAYTWGYLNRQIVFRKGKTLVYVEAGADVERDPDAQTLTSTQKKHVKNQKLSDLRANL
jgi:hypothetical protein